MKPYQLRKPILELIWLERLRQQDLLKRGVHKFTCATAAVSNDKKLRILVEEVGEVAEAIDHMENHAPAQSTDDCFEQFAKRKQQLRVELVQVAAVTIAWLESLEEKP